MTDKKLILRIGSDKAGTITLQRLLLANRIRLTKAGVFAPQHNAIMLIDHLVKQHNLRHIDIFDATRQYKNNPVERTLLAGCLADNFWQEFPTVFLTTEVLWGRLTHHAIESEVMRKEIAQLLHALANFAPSHEPVVVLHLRRGDLYFESLYGQHVKGGGSQNPACYFEKLLAQDRPARSVALLDLLEARFGRENIIIKPFERRQFVNGDLVDDTLGLLGIPQRAWKTYTRGVANERLHRLVLEVLPAINEKQGHPFRRSALWEVSAQLEAIPTLDNQKYLLSRAQRHDVAEHFKPLYDEISRRYLAGRELFHEPFQELPEPMPLDPIQLAAVRSLMIRLAERHGARRIAPQAIAAAIAATGLPAPVTVADSYD